MRILVVSPGRLDVNYGGGQVYVKDLVSALASRHQVTAISIEMAHQGGSIQRRVAGTINVENVICGPAKTSSKGLSAPVMEAATEALKRVQPDLVHAHAWKAEFAHVCHRFRIACVITGHHGGMVCPARTRLDWKGEICSRPVVQESCEQCCVELLKARDAVNLRQQHAPDVANESDFNQSFRRIVPFLPTTPVPNRAAEEASQRLRAMIVPGQLLVAPSTAFAGILIQCGFAPSLVSVVPHGTVPYPRKLLSPGLGNRALRFIFVGRINPVKGLHILFEALQRIPVKYRWQLHVVGQPANDRERAYEAALRSIEAHPTVAGRIMWHGFVDRHQVGELLRLADVLILPSIFMEVFGLVIIEAQSAGRPVITTYSGGPQELVHDGTDGLLVEPGSVSELLRVLSLVLQKPELVTMMAANAPTVRTMSQHVDDLENVYTRALALRPARGR